MECESKGMKFLGMKTDCCSSTSRENLSMLDSFESNEISALANSSIPRQRSSLSRHRSVSSFSYRRARRCLAVETSFLDSMLRSTRASEKTPISVGLSASLRLPLAINRLFSSLELHSQVEVYQRADGRVVSGTFPHPPSHTRQFEHFEGDSRSLGVVKSSGS